MLTGPQIAQLAGAIPQVFNEAELTTLLLGIDRRLLDYVPQLAPFPDQVVQLLGRANAEGWLLPLLAAVLNQRGKTSAMRAFVGLNPGWDLNSVTTAGNPFETLQLLGGKAFIGRDRLRRCVQLMSSATGKKVLLVTSEWRRVGKSYSRDFIDFLSVNQPPTQVAFVDLDTMDFDPLSLARELGRQMGLGQLSSSSSGNQQASRETKEDLMPWLVPSGPPGGTVWWVVLDGFSRRVPSEPIQEFIAQLAQRIQGTVAFRLVLINYLYGLPLAVDLFVFKDKVSRIDVKDIGQHLAKVHVKRYGQPATQDQMTDYIEGFYERMGQISAANPEHADDSLLINAAVTDAAEMI